MEGRDGGRGVGRWGGKRKHPSFPCGRVLKAQGLLTPAYSVENRMHSMMTTASLGLRMAWGHFDLIRFIT